MRAWKSRRSEIAVQSRKGSGTKTVTWADLPGDDTRAESGARHQDPGPSQMQEVHRTDVSRPSAMRKLFSSQSRVGHTSEESESSQASKGGAATSGTSVETDAMASSSPKVSHASSSGAGKSAFEMQP